MDKKTVLVRTPKGNDEVENRTHKINIRLRAALLAVNGTDTVEGILKRMGGLEEMAVALQDLEEQGFLAAAGAPAKAPAPIKPVQPAASVRSSVNISELVRAISNRVHDLLGPSGDVITERLEDSAKNLKQVEPIVQYLEKNRELFEDIAGKQKAAAFFDELHKMTGV